MRTYRRLPKICFAAAVFLSSSAYAQDDCSSTWPVSGTTVNGATTTSIGYSGGAKITVVKTVTNTTPALTASTITKTMHDCHDGFWREFAKATAHVTRNNHGFTYLDERNIEAEQHVFAQPGHAGSTTNIRSYFYYGKGDNNENLCKVYGKIDVDDVTTSSHEWGLRLDDVSTNSGLVALVKTDVLGPHITENSTFELRQNAGVGGLVGSYGSQRDTSSSVNLRQQTEAVLSDDNLPAAFWRSREFLIGQNPPAWTTSSNPRQMFLNFANSQTTMNMAIDESAWSPDLLLHDFAFECQFPFNPGIGL